LRGKIGVKPLASLDLGYKRELGEEEKEKIIRDFLPFIKYTAYRLAWRLPPQLSVEDLISAGIVGLLEALQRYKEGVARLSTFVESRIRGAMLDELRSQSWIPKSMKEKISAVKKAYLELESKLGRPPEAEEVAKKLGISVDEYYKILQSANMEVVLNFESFKEKNRNEEGMDLLEYICDPDAKTPLSVLEESQIKEAIAKVIEELPEKEKLVLSLYYWEEMTMKEIGKVLNITESRVSQLHNQALLRLKAKLNL
jgi:RNA polymerase sigma factor for flagellar operon FliA